MTSNTFIKENMLIDPSMQKEIIRRAVDTHCGDNLLGVHIMGEMATELMHIGLMAMMCNAAADLLVDACFNTPTLGLLYKTATLDALKNVLNLQRSSCAGEKQEAPHEAQPCQARLQTTVAHISGNFRSPEESTTCEIRTLLGGDLSGGVPPEYAFSFPGIPTLIQAPPRILNDHGTDKLVSTSI
jgi:hypothetical protein